MKSIVVAYDQSRGIGADNDLLWQRDLPADLQRFKKLTTGGSIIMGRKTFESIGRPLPERENIVITSQPTGITGILSAVSFEAAYALARYPVFVIGGGQIYGEALRRGDIDRIYATEVRHTFHQATVFFPTLDDTWEEVSRESLEADDKNLYPYDFVVYEKTTAAA